ncbi:MAG: 2-isopropylmalate synthase [Promethearchaeati archaeon SRVP18_Atabeyarchaeia-1]
MGVTDFLRSLKQWHDRGVLFNYNLLPETIPTTMPSRVHIWDETLRDGEQTPGVSLNVNEKIQLAKLLDEIGVDIIVVGYPAVSKHEAEVVKTIRKERFSHASIGAPARALKKDIDACIECEVDEVPIFLATSDLRIKYDYRFKGGRDEVVKRAVESVEYVRQHGMKADFVAEDSTRSDVDFVAKVFKSVAEAGAERVVVADTVGFMRPGSMKVYMKRLMDKLHEQKVNVPVSVHCHNDLGLATANTLTAIEEGADYPHVCVNGYGERAGNAPLEEVVLALEILYDRRTGLKVDKLFELSLLAEKVFCIPIPVHKAIVGGNAFTHESGIHVKGMLFHPLAYEPIDPKVVGRERQISFGKMSGAAGVKAVLQRELKGVELSDEEVGRVLQAIKSRIEHQGEEEKDSITSEFQEKVKKTMTKILAGVRYKEFWEIAGKELRIPKKTLNEIIGRKAEDEWISL